MMEDRSSTREPVLVVDDEADLRGLLLFNLTDAGYAAIGAESGVEALALAEKARPAVVVLDLMLPDLPGIEVCRQIRANPTLRDTAILMLTARGDEYDRLLGFEVGADDYVVKPFSVREVLLRIRALLRRGHDVSERARRPELEWGRLRIDSRGLHVFLDESELVLRRLEYKLLLLFVEHPGKLFSRPELLDRVWGGADVGPRTVDTHVRRLREKLGDLGDCIETVPGFGYRLRDGGSPGSSAAREADAGGTFGPHGGR